MYSHAHTYLRTVACRCLICCMFTCMYVPQINVSHIYVVFTQQKSYDHTQALLCAFCITSLLYLPGIVVCCSSVVSSVPCVRRGRRFESHSSRRSGTLGKSFTHSCLWCFGML